MAIRTLEIRKAIVAWSWYYKTTSVLPQPASLGIKSTLNRPAAAGSRDQSLMCRTGGPRCVCPRCNESILSEIESHAMKVRYLASANRDFVEL